jgi:hypothetical protein
MAALYDIPIRSHGTTASASAMEETPTIQTDIPVLVRPVRRREAIAVSSKWSTFIGGHRADLRNLALIAAGWIALLLLIPPQHEYPIIDDWNHINSVRDMLDTGQFVMPPTMQANLVGLTVWGAGWSKLFGFSITTLTYSTLFLALAGLLAFYGIARSLGVAPAGALLGTALLGFNPIYLDLSYSFMTDVPFVALVLISCFCYVRGVRGHGLDWLWAGGFFSGWAFLIRQFGLLVPVAFFAYLVMLGVLTHKWEWRKMLAVIFLPALAVAVWMVWLHAPDGPGAIQAARQRARFLFKESWLRVFLLRSVALLPITALSAWAAVTLRRSRWWLVPLWAVLILITLFTVDLPGEIWIQDSEPPFSLTLGPLVVALPQQPYTFGMWGNIVRVGGIDFFEYPQATVWSPEAWHLLWALGLLLGALLLAAITSRLIDLPGQGWRERLLTPATPLYSLGAVIFLASMGALGDTYDRYVLGYLPFVLLFVVSGSSSWKRLAWVYSVAGLVLIASFTMLAKSDHVEHNNVRWEAGQWLYDRTEGIHAGYDWDNWGHTRKDDYIIADYPIDGYRIEKRFPYYSRLGGFTTRYVLAQSRKNKPPLPFRPETPRK